MHKYFSFRSLRNWSTLTITLVLMIAAAGCGGDTSKVGSVELKMAPISEMPVEVHAAPSTVQLAYQFAVANPEILSEIPCYCGCGPMGHTSNHACYVTSENTDGSTVFDTHALGCSICVDITQDTMRLLEQGQSVPEIRAFIDETYSQYGPSNIP